MVEAVVPTNSSVRFSAAAEGTTSGGLLARCEAKMPAMSVKESTLEEQCTVRILDSGAWCLGSRLMS